MLYQEFQGEKEDCNQGPLFQVPAKLFWKKATLILPEETTLLYRLTFSC